MSGTVGFQALTSRNAVLSSAENFILYVLMETKPQQGAGVRLPLNLGIVLDRSGSMYDEQRLDNVIEAVKYLVDNLGPEDKASVVAFADTAAVAATADLVTSDKARVKRAIDELDLLEIGGGTQMALGMEAALAEVEKHYSPNRLNRLLVLTDGQTYEERKCLDLARQHRDRHKEKGVELNLAAGPDRGRPLGFGLQVFAAQGLECPDLQVEGGDPQDKEDRVLGAHQPGAPGIH